MSERPAVNASPLIFLSRAGLLELLHAVAKEIAVPQPVADEILVRGPTDITAKAVTDLPWLTTVEISTVPDVIRSWDLGPGESSVLAWALAHPGAEAILDDLAGRRCATSLGIPVRGTLGLVLAAKKEKRIEAARPVLETLRRSGMYLSDVVLNRALAIVDE